MEERKDWKQVRKVGKFGKWTCCIGWSLDITGKINYYWVIEMRKGWTQWLLNSNEIAARHSMMRFCCRHYRPVPESESDGQIRHKDSKGDKGYTEDFTIVWSVQQDPMSIQHFTIVWGVQHDFICQYNSAIHGIQTICEGHPFRRTKFLPKFWNESNSLTSHLCLKGYYVLFAFHYPTPEADKFSGCQGYGSDLLSWGSVWCETAGHFKTIDDSRTLCVI